MARRLQPDSPTSTELAESDAHEATTVDQARILALRASLESITLRDAKLRIPFTKERKKRYLELISEGFSLTEACRIIGITYTTIAHTRKSDDAFDQAHQIATLIATEPVLARLQAIALHGDPGSMATVRAAETYLKGMHPAYRDGRSQAAIELSRTNPDGTVDRIRATANGIPD